ncbi:uncharacterized protein [Linepithema humile]|uniref:uncharacterized protein n=1 Tax=Linepithema humile TaxID=83485 RepID=UPI000623B63C|nr:PREDICTED: uncharacterized protein LOC105668391 [Linepithema humile]
MACPKLVSDFSTPELKWYQTDLTVVIRIQIIDIHDYYLLVQPDHLIFSTTSNDKKYCLILYFYGGVIPEKTVHKNFGREIKVYLTKTLKWYSWLRLTMSKEKSPLISYDQENLCANQPQKKYIVKVREDLEWKNDQEQYILPYDESTEDESEDDDSLFDL